MLTQKRAIIVIATAASIVAALAIAINYNSVLGQQADGQVKFQTFKGALLSVRHAYPDENPNGTYHAISSSLASQNTKLEKALQEAEAVWQMQQDFCTRNDCTVMEMRPYELTVDTEISATEMASMMSAIPASHSQQDVEAAEIGSDASDFGKQVMTKYQQTFVKYNDQDYVVSIRSAWT